MATKLVAKFDNILVKPQDASDQRYGNIVIPDLGSQKALIGQVVSVGPGKESFSGVFVPTTIKVGDVVYLPPVGPIKIEFEREDYWVCPENQVLTTLENE